LTRYFVTGTDTDVGKTYVSVALLRAMAAKGLTVQGLKPVAAGCVHSAGYLQNEDAIRLREASSKKLPYDRVNPWALAPAIAPHIAAREAGLVISLADLQCWLESLPEADFSLVEGAGGWWVPLNGHAYLSDLAVVAHLPVILVVGMRLGCLNHALLTAHAIKASGACCCGWIANQMTPAMPRYNENLAELKQRMPVPWLGTVAYQGEYQAVSPASAGLQGDWRVIP
jgi:dethiobiotin synthetase